MEEQDFSQYDEIDVRNRDETKGFLQDDEQILFSGLVKKINKHKVAQKRILIITNKNLFNIAPKKDLLTSISQWIAPGSALKRKISTAKISELTMSIHPMSEQFIIHVEGEYDYRYDAPGKRNKIIEALLHSYFGHGNSLFSLYLKETQDLASFHTTDDDFKAKIIKRPSLGKVIVTPQLLQKGLEHIISKKDVFMMKGNENFENHKTQSDIKGGQVGPYGGGFGGDNGHMMYSVAVDNFDRSKEINTIDDIPMAESGYIPKNMIKK